MSDSNQKFNALALILIFIKCLATGSLPTPDDVIEFSVDMICAYLETRIGGVKGGKKRSCLF